MMQKLRVKHFGMIGGLHECILAGAPWDTKRRFGLSAMFGKGVVFGLLFLQNDFPGFETKAVLWI
ncbi:MAG: hypothetical protein ACRENG_14775 [bacterium]